MRSRIAILAAAVLIGAAAFAWADDQKQGARTDPPEPDCDGSTSQMVECLAKATEAWDRRLNEAYREALKEAQPKQREQLRAAQRLWIQYRDANCLYYLLGEGSVARLDSASCTYQMTRSRAKELENGLGAN